MKAEIIKILEDYKALDIPRGMAVERLINLSAEQIKELKEYARHKDNCPQKDLGEGYLRAFKPNDRVSCTCGLNQALK